LDFSTVLRKFHGDTDHPAELCPFRSISGVFSLEFFFFLLLFLGRCSFHLLCVLLILVSDEELKRRVAEELALEQAKKESENQKR
jgi:hypothetical protein